MSDPEPTPLELVPVDLSQRAATRAKAAADRYPTLARAAVARQMNGLIRLVIAGDLLAKDDTP